MGPAAGFQFRDWPYGVGVPTFNQKIGHMGEGSGVRLRSAARSPLNRTGVHFRMHKNNPLSAFYFVKIASLTANKKFGQAQALLGRSHNLIACNSIKQNKNKHDLIACNSVERNKNPHN